MLGAVVLGETMAPLQIAGALCIVIGAIASELHAETFARMIPSFTRHAHKRA